ncbi:MAG TPA: tetratricopeptide repeat protein [Rubrobacteraceae bacterium]|nr:tetratricopeptide repeat protein [Rubrobacteraceae bacterium]
MMMDRRRLGCWASGIAIGLSVVFVASFVLFGIGSNVAYSPMDIFGGGNDQQAGQTVGLEDQIQNAEQELEQTPEDPDAIVTLAALYYQNNQLEEAERVLTRGREVAPNEEDIAMLLGQVYYQQAQAAQGEEQKNLYAQAGDAYAAATEIDKENEDAYLAAGDAYDQADQPSEAIKYWNVYLELEPEGQQAEAVEERISAILEGGMTTGGPGAGSTQP